MSVLISKYREILAENGHTGAEVYRSKNLKTRLEKHFSNSITFHRQQKATEPELVYISSIDVKDAINKIANLKRKATEQAIEADLHIPTNESDLGLFNEALKLRASVRQIKTGVSTNPAIYSRYICIDKAVEVVPRDLYEFLCLRLTGMHADDVDKDDRKHRRVLAIAQDIVFYISNARCKTPKHVGLAISVKHITGSKQIIDLLHSQGHCVSYDDVCRFETAIATQVMCSMSTQGDGYLPSNIFPGVFSHAAMDNIDINEETRSGQGTTHVLGSLIYQESMETNSTAKDPMVTVSNVRRKSLKHLSIFEILECPNRLKRYANLSHLQHKVDAKVWFDVPSFSSLLNRP